MLIEMSPCLPRCCTTVTVTCAEHCAARMLNNPAVISHMHATEKPSLPKFIHCIFLIHLTCAPTDQIPPRRTRLVHSIGLSQTCFTQPSACHSTPRSISSSLLGIRPGVCAADLAPATVLSSSSSFFFFKPSKKASCFPAQHNNKKKTKQKKNE